MIKEITGETIKSAMSLKLRNGFAVTSGDPPVTTYPTIYKEQIVEGYLVPSFFISRINVNQRRGMNNNYFRDYMMEVRYHIDKKLTNSYEVLDGVGHKVLEVLSHIDLTVTDGVIPIVLEIRGKDMSYQIIEEVLLVYMTYTIQAKESIAAAPDMSELTLTQVIKE